MSFLLQTRVRFRQTGTTHLSAAIYNTVIITKCPHCNSPGVPHAAAETTGQKRSVHFNHTQTPASVGRRAWTENTKQQSLMHRLGSSPASFPTPAEKLQERTGTEN